MRIRIVVVLIATLFLCSTVSGYYQVRQGDIVYMGETVDIRQAISWPDYQLAYCNATNYECNPPDQIITVGGYQSRYYIDPAIFRYGTYYRWSGEWNSAENQVAFTVIKGMREDGVAKPIELPVEIDVGIKDVEGPFTYIISRGDTTTVDSLLERKDTCHLWVFSDTVKTYNLPMKISAPVQEFNKYTFTFNNALTMAMGAGKYQGYIQCDGTNGIQDIFVDGDVLDTPYDDSVIPDVEIQSWNTINMKRKFDMLRTSMTKPAFDDKLYEVMVEVTEPYVTITDIYRNNEETRLYISGITSWADNTTLQFQIDPEQYPLAQDLRWHTFEAYALGGIDAPRRFSTSIDIEKRELSVGSHSIVMKAIGKPTDAVSTYEFKVLEALVKPTPTPYIRKVLSGIDGKEIQVNPAEATTTPTPTTIPPTTVIPTTVIPTPTPSHSTVTIINEDENTVVVVRTTPEKPVKTPTTPVVVPVPIGIVILSIALAIGVKQWND